LVDVWWAGVGAHVAGGRQVVPEEARGLVLELTSVLVARRERIFAALTTPAELAVWWGPEGFTTPEIDLELRPGGRYRFTMRPPEGDAFHLAGEFLEIQPPSRLAYTFRWEEPDPDDRTTTVTLSLRDLGDATEVSLTQGDFATDARLELHRNGWSDSFDKLARFVQVGS
jgi:uncharacterized protein YndB with AHSA1/START domain